MGLKVQQLQESQSFDAWDDYVLSKAASIYHLQKWRSLIKKVFGHKSYYLYATNSEQQVVGILPLVQLKSLLFGNYLVSMPFFNYGGVVADSDEVEKALLEHAENLRQKLGCSHSEHRLSEESRCGLPVREDKVCMYLQLPSDPDELWQAIGSKRRAQVKRPIREGASFKVGGLELLDDFYYVFCRNMKDLGTPVYSKSFFKSILETFPQNATIAQVYLNDSPAGTGFLLNHQGMQEIPWASTLREYNRFGVNMYLYWNILKHSIESEYKLFDFGRSSKDAGTLKFKKQWGGEEKQLFWYYQLQENKPIPQINHQNKKYELMINTWKKMPLGLCNFLGPHIVKSLP
jgi:FemAB-related protein (PEP-CTERM system-associated)